ncbi:unnamed protein product [Aphanomyces euteiches]
MLPSAALCVTNATSPCRRDNWARCGASDLYFILPGMPWLIFLTCSVVFVWFTNNWREFLQDIDDLHDIPAQALGIVVARQKRKLLGKQIPDPRRIFMLIAMWAELPGFSYLPLELMYYRSTGSLLLPNNPFTQLIKYNCIVGLVGLLGLTMLHRRLTPLRVKVLLPITFDACYVVFLYALLDVITCDDSMDKFVFQDGSTCACTDRVWYLSAPATVLFAVMYISALMYRVHLSEDVFGVRFRYPMSFSFLMTFLRTGCCLLYMTVMSVVQTSGDFAAMPAGVVHFFIFAALLRHNYRLQPCLGSGLFPNNLRSLSFATSCWWSLALVLATLTSSSHVIPLVFLALYPFGVVWLWRVNSKRARQYHIQNQPLTEALQDPNLRVRTVAAVSVTLEDHHRWTSAEVSQIMELLQQCLEVPAVVEDGLLAAYSSQAVWNLCFKHCQAQVVLAANSDAIPFGLWISPSASSLKVRLNTPRASTRLQELVDRNAEINSHRPSVSSTVTPLVTAATPAKLENAALDLLMLKSLEAAHVRALALLELSFPKACNIAAKMLQEMYVAESVQLTMATWISVLCILCSNYNPEVAASAAVSLCATVARFNANVVLPALCHRTKLAAVARLIVAFNPAIPMALLRNRVVGEVLQRAAEYICRVAALRDPSSFVSPQCIGHLVAGWKEWQHDYAMQLALEDVLVLVQKAYKTYRGVARQKLKTTEPLLLDETNHDELHSIERSKETNSISHHEDDDIFDGSASKGLSMASLIEPPPPLRRASSSSISAASKKVPKDGNGVGRSSMIHVSKSMVLEPTNRGGAVGPLVREVSGSATLLLLASPSPMAAAAASNPIISNDRLRRRSRPKMQRGWSSVAAAVVASDSGLNRRKRTAVGVHAVVAQLRSKAAANRSGVPLALWNEIKVRRTMRQRGMTHVSYILREGFATMMLPQLYTPTTAQSLKTLASLMDLFPFLERHLELVLKPDEFKYILFAKRWLQVRNETNVTLKTKPRMAERVRQKISRRFLAWSLEKVPRVRRQKSSLATMSFPRVNFVRERRRRLAQSMARRLGRQQSLT